MKKFNTSIRRKGWKRCGHPYCSDCTTRRGNNRGNRAFRRAAKRELRSQGA